MKTYTTVREDGNKGPELKAENFNEAEEKLKINIKKEKHIYKIVGEKIILNM